MGLYNISFFFCLGPFNSVFVRWIWQWVHFCGSMFHWTDGQTEGLTLAVLLFAADVWMAFTWSSSVCCCCHSLCVAGDLGRIDCDSAVCPTCTRQYSVLSSLLHWWCSIKSPVLLKMLITFIWMTGHMWAVGKFPPFSSWMERQKTNLSFFFFIGYSHCYFLTILWVAFSLFLVFYLTDAFNFNVPRYFICFSCACPKDSRIPCIIFSRNTTTLSVINLWGFLRRAWSGD